MAQNITDILNEIKKREELLWSTDSNGIAQSVPFHMLLDGSYRSTVAFLIYSKYFNIIDFTEINVEEDIAILLSQSKHPNQKHLLDLWMEIRKHYQFTMGLVKILSEYNFDSISKGEESNLEIARWMNDCYLFPTFNEDERTIIFDILDDNRLQLGLKNPYSSILINTDYPRLISNTFKIWLADRQSIRLVFCNCGTLAYNIQVFIAFTDCTNRCQYVKSEDDRLFPFEGSKFGAVYYCKRNDIVIDLPQILNHVEDGGYCVAFNQILKQPSDEFYSYEIPVIIDYFHPKYVLVCKKIKDVDGRVIFGTMGTLDYWCEDAQYCKQEYNQAIRHHVSTPQIQVLKKDDFRYATKEISIQNVFRSPDQLNFVWRRVDDIIKERFDLPQLIYNTHINTNSCINDLSDNPFKLKNTIPPLSNFENKGNGSKHITEIIQLKDETSDHWRENYIPESYKELFDKTFSGGLDGWSVETLDDESYQLYVALNYRLLTESCILFDRNGKALCVSASKENPVACKSFYFGEYSDNGYTAIGCFPNMYPIEIDPQYDKNFILYQLITEKVGYNKRAILVAPTKEEQYTYYLNKRQEYLARYQSVVDEIGDDERTFAVANATVKGIGFRHFRRFMQLPMMNLRGISIFVGGNNAGKSTLVKGLLLTMDNLKAISSKYVHEANSVPQLFFKLDANKYHDVHVGTFNRAFSNLAKRSGNEREMDFTIQIAQFEITMTIRPYEKDDLTLVPIARIQLEDISRKASFVFNFAENITEVALVLKGTSVQANIDTLPNVIHNYNMSILPTYIRSVGDMINDKKTSNAELAVLSGKTGFLQEMASELESVLTHTQIEYIYAHGINQKILFDSSDKNDYMALTLHDLVAENIDPRGREHDFICEWMQAFGIGMDYEISSIGGEAYTIQIRDGMDNMVHLADMGMGASQLLILIFRLATIIHRQQLTHAYNTTIVIEEPEQNMHPAYQSKLAVFFQTVHDKFRLNFIVETHSEYLVRRSQVLVARLQFKDDDELNEKNPFAVYYFPTDKNPYEMIYRTDGNFSNEFGTGFYDESANLLFEIL